MPQLSNVPQAASNLATPDPDAAAAYQEFLPAALATEEVIPYRLIPDLVLSNLKPAQKYVAARRDRIQEHFPKVDIAELDGLGRLALGLKFAAMEVDRAAPAETEMSQRLGEARQLRGTLLATVGALAAAGLVAEARYERIARGRGLRDLAEDCVALAQVFRDGGQALEGKHPLTPQQIDRAAAVGSWLLTHMRPAGAPAEKHEAPEALEIRNRFATLLVARHEKLQAIAHYFEGSGWEEAVPPLRRREAPARRDSGAEEPPADTAPPTVS